MSDMSFFWLGAFIVLLIIEACTAGLTTVWFAAGALLAFGCSLPDMSITVQIIVFILSSAVLLIFTRPIVKKFLTNKQVKTNVDAFIGKEALVNEEINNLLAKGQIKCDGSLWSAKSLDGNIIPAESTVIIKEITGVHAVVVQKEE